MSKLKTRSIPTFTPLIPKPAIRLAKITDTACSPLRIEFRVAPDANTLLTIDIVRKCDNDVASWSVELHLYEVKDGKQREIVGLIVDTTKPDEKKGAKTLASRLFMTADQIDVAEDETIPALIQYNGQTDPDLKNKAGIQVGSTTGKMLTTAT